MKIGINLLYLLPGEVGGTETYAVCLLEALAALENDDEYIIYCNREAAELPIPKDSRFRKEVCPLDARSRPNRYLFEQFRLPFLLWRHGVDLVHSLGYVGPLFAPCKRVVSIPDTNYYDLRENFPPVQRLMLTFFSTWSARLSESVVTISNFSKGQIHKHLGIPLEKITVTHLGPGWLEQPVQEGDWPAVKQKYGLPDRYIFALGGGARHKNIPRLIKAYCADPSLHDLPLVIGGRLFSPPPEFPRPAPGEYGPRIQCLGFVPTADLRPLLANASVYVLPTLYEGFGMPILEAQHAGALVASSNAASLPEVGGEGAIYFDPFSTEAIGAALFKVLNFDQGQADALRKAAQMNLARFTWAGSAKQSRSVYLRLLVAE